MTSLDVKKSWRLRQTSKASKQPEDHLYGFHDVTVYAKRRSRGEDNHTLDCARTH